MANPVNRIRLVCLTIAILALGAIPVASATLSGMVTDQTDGQPLLGATITARPTDPAMDVIGTAANDDGTYELDLPPGTYTVSISFVGYTTSSFSMNTEVEGFAVFDSKT